MKARFEPDDSSSIPAPLLEALADPEPYDASEQRFAASLDSRPEPQSRRFSLDSGNTAAQPALEAAPGESSLSSNPSYASSASKVEPLAEPAPDEPGPLAPDGAWRQEVSARVNQYRARKRVRAPRYPSLQLRFETPDTSWSEQPTPSPSAPPSLLAVAMQDVVPQPVPRSAEESSVVNPAASDTGAKIIEFPRFFAAPQFSFDELAEPVLDRPRILEVPEQLPPPPALGGMLIEPKEIPPAERRPGFELPLSPPSMSRRTAAALTDASLVAASFAAFAYIFFRIAGVLPPLKESLAISAGLMAAFWAAYQYLFLVHSGMTPGLKLAKLRLGRFDGAPVPRNLRRWRVLASVLSLLSLGLGYAWCFLDEDQLCWHDRITRTYMASSRSSQTGPAASPETV
jgi:uncharacterized RDD family membrane protein YckC